MHLKTNRGYSLAETLVAVAIVASLATLVTSMNMFSTSGEKTNYHRVCESIANSTIAVVQERGPIEAIDRFVPIGVARTMGAYNTGTIPRGTTAPQLFDGSAFFNILSNPAVRSNPPNLNNYQQIRGSIRTLSSIYNSTPGVRCNWQAYAPVTPNLAQIRLPVALVTLNPVVQINLVPFNTTTGATEDCALIPTLHIAPPPNAAGTVNDAFFNGSGSQALPANYDFPGAPAVGGTSIAARTAGVSANRGIIMNSRVSFQVQGGEQINCQSAQRFQYATDRNAPTAPRVTITNNSSTGLPTSAADRCTAGGLRNVTLEVGYAANPEPGTQLFCRDLSSMRGYTQPASTTTNAGGVAHSVPCVLNSGIDTSALSSNLVHSLDDANMPPNDYSQRGQNLGGVNQEFWRPCDQVKICNRAPTAAVPLGAGFGYTLTYALPQGCIINLESRGVDTAGNISPLSSFPQYAAPANIMDANRILQGTSSIMEVYKPVCGFDFSSTYYKATRGTYCRPVPAAQDDNYAGYVIAPGSFETFNWSPSAVPANNTVGGINYRARFPNGYYTCRGSPGFPKLGGTADGCCYGAGCTPFN